MKVEWEWNERKWIKYVNEIWERESIKGKIWKKKKLLKEDNEKRERKSKRKRGD